MTLELTDSEYILLLLVLGIGVRTGLEMNDREFSQSILKLTNKINANNPNFKQYADLNALPIDIIRG